MQLHLGAAAILMGLALLSFVLDMFVATPKIKFLSLGLAFMAASFLVAGAK